MILLSEKQEYIPHIKGIRDSLKGYRGSNSPKDWHFRTSPPSIKDYAKGLQTRVEQDNSETMFIDLAKKWRKETAGISSVIHKTILNPTYLKIIKNGDRFLPFILKDLEKKSKEPDDWFVALEHIAEHNPVSQKDFGFVTKMAEAWISWGKQTGKI